MLCLHPACTWHLSHKTSPLHWNKRTVNGLHITSVEFSDKITMFRRWHKLHFQINCSHYLWILFGSRKLSMSTYTLTTAVMWSWFNHCLLMFIIHPMSAVLLYYVKKGSISSLLAWGTFFHQCCFCFAVLDSMWECSKWTGKYVRYHVMALLEQNYDQVSSIQLLYMCEDTRNLTLKKPWNRSNS